MRWVDSASRLIAALPKAIYDAFAKPGAMEGWLPPGNMKGDMLHFDFREGGSYRMRLTYTDPDHRQGKTSEHVDEVEVRLTRLEENRSIEQEIRFDSEDPLFSCLMRMTWTFEPACAGTVVTIRAEDVPEGIRHEDHIEGFRSSLEHLANFVETAE